MATVEPPKAIIRGKERKVRVTKFGKGLRTGRCGSIDQVNWDKRQLDGEKGVRDFLSWMAILPNTRYNEFSPNSSEFTAIQQRRA